MNRQRPGATPHYDVLIVGGGVNGAGIARDAAGRGLRVLLCEQDDLAAHTSSASTKLIHGGLRYMERLHVGLVRKALKEREIVLDSAPHISWPLRFVIPHDERVRSAWMIRIGLVLYDNLARRRRLAGSHGIELRTHVAGQSLQSNFKRGFVYSDGWIDDARLVILNAIDAAEHGATILPRTRCQSVIREPRRWRAALQPRGGASREITARVLVNATGPWAAEFAHQASPQARVRGTRLVKGSHIVVPRLFDHAYAYIFQNPDRRVIFAIPYERDFTLIGTTDLEFRGDPAAVAIEPAELDYLCASANRFFMQQITPRDVVWSYSGVRPLSKDETRDPTAVSRDYTLEFDQSGPPLLSVFGGKITTFRRLAEEAAGRISTSLGRVDRPWTAGRVLPGGDLPNTSFSEFSRLLASTHPWLPDGLRDRYAHAYGTRIHTMIGAARSVEELGEEVAPGLYAREIEYLRSAEWAETAEDILWRRTKLGLHLSPDARDRVAAWLERATRPPTTGPVARNGVTGDA